MVAKNQVQGEKKIKMFQIRKCLNDFNLIHVELKKCTRTIKNIDRNEINK